MKKNNFTVLKPVATALAIVYVIWNIIWLAQFRLPPSLFLSLTGYPAPTTGMTRAIKALWHGNYSQYWQHNPMALPVAILYVFTVAYLIFKAFKKQRLYLPRRIFILWIIFLSISWAIKLGISVL